MMNSILLSLFCLPSVGSAPTNPPAPHAAQKPAEFPDRRPAVKELLAKLKADIGEHGERDTRALVYLEELADEFKQSGPKDRASIVAGLAKCLEQTRKPKPDGFPNNTLYVPVANHLGKMAPESTKLLIKWIGHKKHRENLVLQRELILSLGRTKDLAAVKSLIALLQYKNDRVVAWAGTALGQFGEAPLKIRKQVFEELLQILITNKTLKDANGNDLLARRRYEAVAGPFMSTLSTLSGKSFAKPDAWQTWWKENRKANWDEQKDG